MDNNDDNKGPPTSDDLKEFIGLLKIKHGFTYSAGKKVNIESVLTKLHSKHLDAKAKGNKHEEIEINIILSIILINTSNNNEIFKKEQKNKLSEYIKEYTELT